MPVIVSGDEGSVFTEVIDSEILADGNNQITGGNRDSRDVADVKWGVSQLS